VADEAVLNNVHCTLPVHYYKIKEKNISSKEFLFLQVNFSPVCDSEPEATPSNSQLSVQRNEGTCSPSSTEACSPSTTGACSPSTTGACSPSTTGACYPSTTGDPELNILDSGSHTQDNQNGGLCSPERSFGKLSDGLPQFDVDSLTNILKDLSKFPSYRKAYMKLRHKAHVNSPAEILANIMADISKLPSHNECSAEATSERKRTQVSDVDVGTGGKRMRLPQGSAAAPDSPNCRKSALKSKKVKHTAVKKRGVRDKVKKKENTGAAQSIDNGETLATNSQNAAPILHIASSISFSPDSDNVIVSTPIGECVIPIKQNGKNVIMITYNGELFSLSTQNSEIVNLSGQNSEIVNMSTQNSEIANLSTGTQNSENVILITPNGEFFNLSTENGECVIPVIHNSENVVQIIPYAESVIENGENVSMITTNTENEADPNMSDENAVSILEPVQESESSEEPLDERRWVRGGAGGYPLQGIK
jgi:hypothetical protein